MPSYHNIRFCNNTFGAQVNSWTRLGPVFWIGRDERAVYKCKCGRIQVQYVRNIEAGKSTRCRKCSIGPIRHGKSHTRVHNIWCGILTRCDNPNFKFFHNYGGRGITICDRWRVFEKFYEDMGDPPPGFSIERIDCDGNYCPENCIWVHPKKQYLNKRKTRRFSYKGKMLTTNEISELTGVKSKLIYERICHRDWDVERAAETHPSEPSIKTLRKR